MEYNPFTSIEEKLNNIEKMLLELKASNANSVPAETETLPVTGDINLAVSITGLKKSTIYKMTATGSIPFSKPSAGKLIFISKDLLEWVNSNKR
jgi:excisionase family DNA binding protein